jgi:Ni/Fe-hydrogenase b-type cytochrome subunit
VASPPRANPLVLPGRRDTDLVRTRVWELPVRVAHWLIVLAIAVLTATGLFIHRPYLPAAGWNAFLMAWMRFAHILAGFTLIAALVLRFYWFFKGNLWARWTAYVPLKSDQWAGMGSMLEYYSFLRFTPVHRTGHNALAALTYLVIYILLVVEVLSGVALLARVAHSPGVSELIGWVPKLLAMEYVRELHFFLMFAFLAFAIFHVYLSILVGIEEQNGLMDSIFSGFKFVPVRELRAEVARVEGRKTYEKKPLPLPERGPGRAAVRGPAPGPVLLFQNWTSYVGALVAAIGLVLFLVLFLYHVVGGGAEWNPYGDLVVFTGAPAVVVVGIALILLGMYLRWLRWRFWQPLSYPRYPLWDLNVARDRKALLVFTMAGVVLLGLTVYAGINNYSYTDATVFCASTCHAMIPERATHPLGPHANVECAGCHIGAGAAGWFNAKLRGLEELYAQVTDEYPRPIPTPLRYLRPVREECEHCHWPPTFYGGSQRRQVHFMSDEQNSRWEIDLLVLVGSGRPEGPQPLGIHWHVAGRVEYVASDRRRQEIPWVRATDPVTGAAVVYTAGELPKGRPDPDMGSPSSPLVMACIDCHNRPAHFLAPPVRLVDDALANGRIDGELPFVRREAVAALSKKYNSTSAARAEIAKALAGFYAQQYPQLQATKGKSIEGAVAAVQAIYDASAFPTMNARWDTYPNYQTHMNDRGCFRCHDGNHKSADGKAIRSDCNACHVIGAQGPPGKMATGTLPNGLEFQHPGDIGDAWKGTACSDCHTGGSQ